MLRSHIWSETALDPNAVKHSCALRCQMQVRCALLLTSLAQICLHGTHAILKFLQSYRIAVPSMMACAVRLNNALPA